MYSGYSRTTTDFKNKCSQTLGFQGFPYIRFGDLTALFAWKFQNIAENAQGVMKKCKNLEIFKT